jgi:hypothetical protein
MKKKNNLTFLIISFFIIFLYFLNSILIGKNYYGNHLFLLFSEASRFYNGDLLYKQIYVTYGIGQTLINVASLYLFGENTFSLYLIANIFFFLSIFFILLICLKLKFSNIESFFLIIILINISPALINPWGTYLAYLPIVLSLYFLLNKNKINLFFSGFLLSIACLIKETILITAIIILSYVIFELLFKRDRKVKIQKQYSLINFYMSGFLSPTLIFIIYMLISNNYLIWVSLIYPSYRESTLAHLGYYINPNKDFLREIYLLYIVPFRAIGLVFLKSFYNLWIDWILIFISYLLSFFIIFKRVFQNKQWKEIENQKYIFSIISVYCISFIIQNLHIADLMRVATGSILGIIITNYFLKKFVKKDKIKILIYISIIFLIFFRSSTFVTWGNNMNLKDFYILSEKNIKNNLNLFIKNKNNSETFEKIPEFKHMNYDFSTHKFYLDLKRKCIEIKNNKKIMFSDNHTEIWEASYFCKTQPLYYFPFTFNNVWVKLFPNTKITDVYNNKENLDKIENYTINFYLSENFLIIKDRFGKNINLKDYNIIYAYDLKKTIIEKTYGKRYFLILQKKE